MQKFTLVNSETELYGVFGNPVAHSLSPVMHNYAFGKAGLNCLYMAFKVVDIQAAVTGIRGLDIKGASVTIPHKIDVMPYLDEIDGKAAQIGAVNTIVNKKGKLQGYNTDCYGAVQALVKKTTLWGKSVGIFGSGGAARAIGFGLIWEGARVTIFNRSCSSGERLAKELGGRFRTIPEFAQMDIQIVINATSMGMSPNISAIPIDPSLLQKEMIVMDIVYNPLKTTLLKAAETIGCQTIDGVEMFVNQGAAQFELWTGMNAPIEAMEKCVRSELMSLK